MSRTALFARPAIALLVAFTSLLVVLSEPSGAQFDYTSSTTVTLVDPGTGAATQLEVVSATYGYETISVRTAATRLDENFDRLRLRVAGAALGPGVVVTFLDATTGASLGRSGLVLSGDGTNEILVAVSQTPRQAFVLEIAAEAFIASAPTTTTVLPTTIVAPSTTQVGSAIAAVPSTATTTGVPPLTLAPTSAPEALAAVDRTTSTVANERSFAGEMEAMATDFGRRAVDDPASVLSILVVFVLLFSVVLMLRHRRQLLTGAESESDTPPPVPETNKSDDETPF